jgi:hypothetical protein
MRRPLARRSESGIWVFSGWCETQYASSPSCGGLQQILRCHAVIDLLGKADQLGVVASVPDEGGYWEHREELETSCQAAEVQGERIIEIPL